MLVCILKELFGIKIFYLTKIGNLPPFFIYIIHIASRILDHDLHIRMFSYTDQNPEHHFKYHKKYSPQYLPKAEYLDKS